MTNWSTFKAHHSQDCVHLIEAFRELRSIGIAACLPVEYEQGDAIKAMWERYASHSKYRGYCTFTTQDFEIDNGLWFSYGLFDMTAKPAQIKALAQTISDVLAQHDHRIHVHVGCNDNHNQKNIFEQNQTLKRKLQTFAKKLAAAK